MIEYCAWWEKRLDNHGKHSSIQAQNEGVAVWVIIRRFLSLIIGSKAYLQDLCFTLCRERIRKRHWINWVNRFQKSYPSMSLLQSASTPITVSITECTSRFANWATSKKMRTVDKNYRFTIGIVRRKRRLMSYAYQHQMQTGVASITFITSSPRAAKPI